MKLTSLFVFASIFSILAGNGYSQTITLDLKNVTVTQIIDKIEATSDYRFVYNIKFVDLQRKVSIKVKDVKIQNVLSNVFEGTYTAYKVIDTQIILREKKKESITINNSTSLIKTQGHEISGTIRNVKGFSLPGANIVEVGTNNGAQSDFDGNFSLTVADQNATLSISHLGFITVKVPVNGRSVVAVVLESVSANLETVIVVGYGTQSKRDVTDNIATITSDQINEIPTPGMQSALTGKVAGVRITQVNGKVEGGIKVRVRGVATISSSQEPLYVIDGVPVSNDDESTNGSPLNPLISINPNDIASVSILKDASSAAIYGARATNGVVLITTKRGKEGKTRVSINSSYGWSQPTNKRDWLNAEQYKELFTEASRNSPFFSPDDGQAFVEDRFNFYSNGQDVDTDWQDLALVDGSIEDFGISVSGGSGKTKFFLSTGYNKTNGIVRENNLDRYSVRTNIDHNISDKLKTGVNAMISRTKISRLQDDNGFGTPLQALAQVPLSPAYLEDGITPNGQSTEYYNFLLNGFNGEFKTNIWRIIANTFFEYKIFPELKFRTDFGYDLTSQVAESFSGSLTESVSTNGSAQANTVNTEKYVINNYFTYDKSFNKTLDLKVDIGMSFEDRRRRQQNVQGINFSSDDLRTLDSAGEITGGGSNRTASNLLSYFGRTSLSIANKYLLKGSLRTDGSSRFSKDNRFGIFPALSAGWIVSEEDFLLNSEILSFFKLRTSWGITGNNEIQDFASKSLISSVAYNRRSGLTPVQLGNEDLKWESTTQVDFGIDFGFFDNRISGEIDYYVKNTNDLLLDEPVPGTSGFSTITRNTGELQNKGYEFVLNTKNIVSENIQWNTSFNMATLKNKIKSLPGGDIIADNNIVREGETLSSFYLVEYAGVNPDNGDALFVLNTENADGTLNKEITNNFLEAERVVSGSPFPNFIAGLTNTINYRNIDFSVTFQGEWGASIFNTAGQFQSGNARSFDNQTVDQLNRWQQPGDVTNVPQVRLFDTNGQQATTRYLQESDFIRLRNLTLGYTIPSNITKKINIERFRIYLSGLNLLTFTDYDGYDPESTADFLGNSNVQAGIDFYAAPAARTYTLGLNIDF